MEPEETNEVLFEMPVEMELRKSVSGDRRIIRGYASTEDMDQDGEVVIQNGIDFTPLLKSGFINYDHQGKCLQCGLTHDRRKCPNCNSTGKMPIIIGHPTFAGIKDKGLWVESELLKSTDCSGVTSQQLQLADEMWALGMSLQKSGSNRRLAYSVEGGILQRHPTNEKKIIKSVVAHCALTHKPVNPSASVELMMKSICCGRCSPQHPLYIPGHTCGSHAPVSKEDKEDIQKSLGTDAGQQMANGNSPVMVENLDRGFTSLLYGPTYTTAPCGCFNTDTMAFNDGIPGAVEHLQKCRGATKDQAITFLRKAVNIAGHRPDVQAALKTAGIVR